MNREKLSVCYKAKNFWVNNNCVGAYEHPTGFGKTFEGILAMSEILQRNSEAIVLILVESEINRSNWKKRLIEHGYQNKLDISIHVFSVNEVINWNLQEIKTDLLIIDELHSYTTTKRLNLLSNIKAKYILGLTGTYKEIEKINKLAYNWFVTNIPIVHELSVDECVKNKFISEFVEYNLSLDLTERERILYDEYSQYIKFTLTLFKNNYDLLNKCIFGDNVVDNLYYINYFSTLNGYTQDLDMSSDYNRDIDKYFNPKNVLDRVVNYKKIEKLRNDLLDSNQTKVKAVLEIVKKFNNNNKAILFSKSTAMADLITSEINKIFPDKAASFHSNIESQYLYGDNNELVVDKNGKPKKFSKNKIKQNILGLFLENELRYLSTCSALDKALDVQDINLVITLSGTANPATYIQRRGRGTRLNENDNNKLAIIINLYFAGTRDETKLHERQSTSNSTIKWIKSIDEIC